MGAAAGAEAAAFPWESCFMQLSGGAVAGLAVGYAAKAALKAALLVLGSVIIFLALMAHAGFITVNWDAITLSIEEGTKMAEDLAVSTISQLSSSMVGFAAGAIGGWKLHH